MARGASEGEGDVYGENDPAPCPRQHANSSRCFDIRMVWERFGLWVSFLALGLWAFTAVGSLGLLGVLAIGGTWWGLGWLVFPLPFALYVLVYALRRWRAPLADETSSGHT